MPVTFPICPGVVDTDAGEHDVYLRSTRGLTNAHFLIGKVAIAGGGEFMSSAFESKPADYTASMILEQIDKATRSEYGGEFWNWDGTKIEW
jgi:hypothetical protein